jgi:hypothetical protein
MVDAWQILRDGGLPIATETSGRHPTATELAAAILAAIGSHPTGRDSEALAAFVLAWRQHWPSTFATELGAHAEAVLEWARRNAHDEDRYLKLRRIAIENLSHVL